MSETPVEREKITAKDAAVAARDYYQNVVGDHRSTIELEEIELSEDGKYWCVTLSVHKDEIFVSSVTNTVKYKVFEIDVHTGNVQSMKIHSIEP